MGTCFCWSYIKDVKPRTFDQSDQYEQFEIIRKRSGFHAKPVGTDGFPPLFLRRKYWNVYFKDPHHYQLEEALGVDVSLRARMPDFNFPVSYGRSQSVVVGKWYCPFIFVKEGKKVNDQMMESVFYQMTLEQRWDKIFEKENVSFEEKHVLVKVDVEREVVIVGEKAEAIPGGENVADGFMWFKSTDGVGGEMNVGLSLAIVERMKLEQERAGWSSGSESKVSIKRAEEYRGTVGWRRFGCYVLDESFVLKRMNGSVVLQYDFKHTQQMRCKWE